MPVYDPSGNIGGQGRFGMEKPTRKPPPTSKKGVTKASTSRKGRKRRG